MGKAPAFQFYSSDFLTGTMLMSNAEVGLYIRLLCLQAEHGSVPDDVERIVQAFGEPSRVLWSVVRSKFEEGEIPGTLVNARLGEVLEARNAYRQKQSVKGTLSAKARLSRGSTVVEPLEDRDRVDTLKEGTREERKTLFANSRFIDIEVVKASLPELVTEGVNLDHYRDAIRNWSDTKDEKRSDRGWLATFRQWTKTDRDKGELKKIAAARPAWNPRA
jgi:hypothetical protein